MGHNRDGVDRGPRYGVVGGKGWGEGVYGDGEYGKFHYLPPNCNDDDAPLIEKKTPNQPKRGD